MHTKRTPSETFFVTYTTCDMSELSVKSTRRFRGKIYKGLKEQIGHMVQNGPGVSIAIQRKTLANKGFLEPEALHYGSRYAMILPQCNDRRVVIDSMDHIEL